MLRPGDEEVRALATEILRRPEFARYRTLESDLLTTIQRWINEYLGWLVRLHVESPVLYWLFVLGLVGLAAALIGHIVWSLRIALAARTAPDVERGESRPTNWLGEAERLAAGGRFLEAAHHLVLGSIELLVARGIIELRRADANSVLRDRVLRSTLPAPLRREFLELLDTFETRWFRDRVEDGALFRSWRGLHARLVASARGSA